VWGREDAWKRLLSSAHEGIEFTCLVIDVHPRGSLIGVSAVAKAAGET
jgi:hypothetical protein